MAISAKSILGLGSGSSSPAPALPAFGAPPTLDNPSMAAVAERRARRSGLTAPARNGTLLTGASGLTTPAPTVRTSLLGG